MKEMSSRPRTEGGAKKSRIYSEGDSSPKDVEMEMLKAQLLSEKEKCKKLEAEKRQRNLEEDEKRRKEEEEMLTHIKPDLSIEHIDGLPRELLELSSELTFISKCEVGQVPIWSTKTYVYHESSNWWTSLFYRRYLGENKEYLLKKYKEVVDRCKAQVRRYKDSTYSPYLRRRIDEAIKGMQNFRTTYKDFHGFVSDMTAIIDSLRLLCGADITKL